LYIYEGPLSTKSGGTYSNNDSLLTTAHSPTGESSQVQMHKKLRIGINVEMDILPCRP